MAAASEAEIGALFHNGQETVHLRQILADLGRPQQEPTTIITDNSTADGFANQCTKLKRSKAMDMRFFWVQEREAQEHFRVCWCSGKTNHGDYFTKHHVTCHPTTSRYDQPTPSQDAAHAQTAQVQTPDCRGVLIRDSGLTSLGVIPYPYPVPISTVAKAHY
jgi:hypothetical protein